MRHFLLVISFKLGRFHSLLGAFSSIRMSFSTIKVLWSRNRENTNFLVSRIVSWMFWDRGYKLMLQEAQLISTMICHVLRIYPFLVASRKNIRDLRKMMVVMMYHPSPPFPRKELI